MTDHKPSKGLLAGFEACLGLCALGVGGVFSWLRYGTGDVTRHLDPMILTAALSITAGLYGERLLRSLTRKKR